MESKIQLLDCTLRDGCYIVSAKFGTPVMRGILKKLTAANVDIIECGWLKDSAHEPGTAFYHVPADALDYLPTKRRPGTVYAAMIDWDRYDLGQLPPCDGRGIDAIRMVFPHGKFKEAIPLGRKIREQGYRLFFQAANTLGYSDQELVELAGEISRVMPESLSIVDTFGAMYPEDLERIFTILDRELAPEIKLGFHSHNNQQLSFALSMEFVRLGEKSARRIVVDSSLCGMGRGAGNTTTELLANFLDRKYHGDYDMNEIMDTIDLYMSHLSETYKWGYSIPYCIAGIYCTHVNNIAYLLKNHHTRARDMRVIIESISPEKRKVYDYDNLEKIYLDYQNRLVDDSSALAALERKFSGREVLLLGPGKTLSTHRPLVEKYISEHRPLTVAVNALPENFRCGSCFFVNPMRYMYAQETQEKELQGTEVILTSNIKREAAENERIVNFNLLCKLGWEFFDNACVMALRLMAKLHAGKVVFAGFDGFPEDEKTASFYADRVIQPAVPVEKRIRINRDVADMLRDFVESDRSGMEVEFLTPSIFRNIIK